MDWLILLAGPKCSSPHSPLCALLIDVRRVKGDLQVEMHSVWRPKKEKIKQLLALCKRLNCQRDIHVENVVYSREASVTPIAVRLSRFATKIQMGFWSVCLARPQEWRAYQLNYRMAVILKWVTLVLFSEWTLVTDSLRLLVVILLTRDSRAVLDSWLNFSEQLFTDETTGRQ